MKNPIILLALVALLGSCKKDSSSAPATAGETTLTTGTWKITASTSIVEYPAPIGTQTVNLYDMFNACEIDNIYTFNANKSVTSDEGPTKCNAADPQTTTEGTWALSNNDTKLTTNGGGFNITADVLTLDNSTLKIKYVTNINNIPATTTTTYARP
jgi:hypothetical protein